MKLLIQREIFQQQATLNLESRYYLISILVEGLLSDVKKQIEENAIQVATQFFEELKTSVLQIADNLYNFSEKLRLEEQKKTYFFLNPKTSPWMYCKNSVLQKQRYFLEELSFFLCVSEMQVFSGN